jgi:hypothetical protein
MIVRPQRSYALFDAACAASRPFAEVVPTPPQHGVGTMAFSRQIVNKFSGAAMSRLTPVERPALL